MITHSAHRIGIYVMIGLGLFSGSAVHAESIVWGTDLGAPLYMVRNGTSYYGGEMCVAVLGNSHVDVTYGADALDASGVPVCGTSITPGTKITFRFRPRSSQDIYWFGTGYSWDSPYGDWSAASAPPASAASFCSAKNYYDSTGGSDFYGNLAIDTAASRSVSNLAGFNCQVASNGYDQVCTATGVGTFTPRFDFGPATGKFYATYVNSGSSCEPLRPDALRPLQTVASEYWPRDGTGWRGCTGASSYTLSVPAQSISCPITVVAATGAAPTLPTVVSGATSCTTGTAYVLSFSASDPDQDPVRYLIDWNNDAAVDQIVPPMGFLASGATASASRTYTLPGKKTVRVRSQDMTGLVSAWATVSFVCEPGRDASATATLFDDDGNLRGGGAIGITTTSAADISLRAVPSLVQRGATTKLNWSSTNMTSCRLTGTNQDTWDTLESVLGGQITSPINAQTIYTLSCLGIDGQTQTKTVEINILPNWQEQ